ncbi:MULTISPECIES: acetamidase/formamidase family protein [Paraburkholderia]|uniref:Acetamidase/formamidase family protein n=1 Tax=Paraburkholderia madseniana TaxID=2599607 RepID=A0AAP5BKQ8_9BURK|nr:MULTISPECIES: acetamidase/formamidase family protein [Paraburkholderia]MCX4149786.1 acetamidase/formamidase family protein [Paraburkholderia madseniana]MDN7152722.1 acetamidase/formamidase family protein [Paraburkholderia sp. WS6]MDQ6411604.1 acetamidase/formamidase family protein [Paraburkholderia madseniana]
MKRETEQRDAVGVTGATDDRHASTCDATDACRRSILKLGFGAFAAGALGLSGAARAQSGSSQAAKAATASREGQTIKLVPSLETVKVGQIEPSAPTAVTIKSGDTVWYDGTWTNWGNEAKYGLTFKEREPIRKKYPNGPFSLIGPVSIIGAEAGDLVECRMLKMRPIDWGWNSAPPGVGALPHDFKPYLRYLKFDKDRTAAAYVPGVNIPLQPFQAYIATQPAGEKPISANLAGNYGGNLDCAVLGVDTSIFLPVQVTGARVWTGGSMGASGEGNVDQTSIETAFEEMRIQYILHKGAALNVPMAETPDHWIGFGFSDSLENSLVACLRQMISWLSAASGIAPEDCYGIYSVAGSFRVTQYANQTGTVYSTIPPKGIHCMLPKRIFTPALQQRIAASIRA